jgi:hypothetical protein
MHQQINMQFTHFGVFRISVQPEGAILHVDPYGSCGPKWLPYPSGKTWDVLGIVERCSIFLKPTTHEIHRFLFQKWRLPKSWGYPNSWMVYFLENPIKIGLTKIIHFETIHFHRIFHF